MANTEVILKFLSNCDFQDVLTEDDFYEKVIECLPKNVSFRYDYGATKLVIIFPGADYVIKIPFTGFYTYTEEDDIEYIEFENGGNGWDYCEREIDIYFDAMRVGLEKFFAKTELIGHICGHPIYIQERAEILGECVSKHTSFFKKNDNIREICNEKGYLCFNVYWVAELFECYPEQDFNNLMKYITDYICDLHSENIGYIDDVPVLVDYAGFNS